MSYDSLLIYSGLLFHLNCRVLWNFHNSFSCVTQLLNNSPICPLTYLHFFFFFSWKKYIEKNIEKNSQTLRLHNELHIIFFWITFFNTNNQLFYLILAHSSVDPHTHTHMNTLTKQWVAVVVNWRFFSLERAMGKHSILFFISIIEIDNINLVNYYHGWKAKRLELKRSVLFVYHRKHMWALILIDNNLIIPSMYYSMISSIISYGSLQLPLSLLLLYSNRTYSYANVYTCNIQLPLYQLVIICENIYVNNMMDRKKKKKLPTTK